MTTASLNQYSKRDLIIYWIFTSIVFLFDGLGALGSGSKMAVESMRHLGFPDYFRWELAVFKVIGGFCLILPFVPQRLKEWSYVGFGISTISAIVANFAIGDPNNTQYGIMAIVVFIIILISYIYYHKTYGKNIYKS